MCCFGVAVRLEVKRRQGEVKLQHVDAAARDARQMTWRSVRGRKEGDGRKWKEGRRRREEEAKKRN